MKNLHLPPFSFLLVLLILFLTGCRHERQNHEKIHAEEHKIRAIHQEYVNGWKAMDESRIMHLLEDYAIIQPNTLSPIIGKENIRNFWFPKDSSKTTIVQYDTEILSLLIQDTMAITTHKSYLDWDYVKEETSFGMQQNGINTTIYRRQPSKEWKMWRSMWADISATRK